jgi:hypothetical protein
MPIIISGFTPDCALHEMNDELARAWGPLEFGQVYLSYLCAYDPVDWYFIDLPRPGALSVDLAVPLKQDLDLFLHAANGNVIAESTTFGEGADERIITTIQAPGRYYLRVLPYSRRDPSQPYEIMVDFL